jgi:hypothetical protein
VLGGTENLATFALTRVGFWRSKAIKAALHMASRGFEE